MKLFYKISVILIIYALLAIPDSNYEEDKQVAKKKSKTTNWWSVFAENLVKYKITNSEYQNYQYNKHQVLLDNHLNDLELQLAEPENPIYDSIRFHLNKLSALSALKPNKLVEFQTTTTRCRNLIKYQSRFWDLSDVATTDKIFQLITEVRLAFESALIQSNIDSISWSLSPNQEEENNKSESVLIDDIYFKSGDIIVFDFVFDKNIPLSYIKSLPNSDHHLASIYINESSSVATYIDYKAGIVSEPLELFVKKTAPNGIILRLRKDFSALRKKPELPHLAASIIKNKSGSSKIYYDFNFNSDTKNYLYDWDLINNEYIAIGLIINAKNLLTSNNVSLMGTDKPHITAFDLEYSPDFTVAGEWYSTQLLYDNRVRTAATIQFSQSDYNSYNQLLLPIYRVLKLYSLLAYRIDMNAPIPTGVSAQNYLIANHFFDAQAKAINLLINELDLYEERQNHKATYLKMLQAASEIRNEQSIVKK